MAKTLRGPRRGSAAYNALDQLVQLGGSATFGQLTGAVLSYFRSARRFNELAIEPLVRAKLVRLIDRDEVRITAAGLAFIRPVDRSVTTTSAIAGIKEPPPFKPLSSRHFASMAVRREGADDFRQYPSLMGGVRVPYRGQR